MNLSSGGQVSSSLTVEKGQENSSSSYVGHALLASLLPVCVAMHVWSQRTKSQMSSTSNPCFKRFQRQFLTVYFLALFSDWLQGPYIYELYSYYGFVESQIAVLYVIGFAASVLFGTATGMLADRFGRKKMCLAFSVIYSLCCLTKLSRNFNVLLLGRVFGGIATSMLFSSFESWYVYEHVQRHDFPVEWLPVSFSKITFWNGVLAINAGVAANVCVDLLDWGPVAPFMLAVPFLVTGGIVVWRTWPENYGNVDARFCTLCNDGLRAIVSDIKVLLLGIVQSLFESVMYIFVFLWTPVLEPLNLPLGLIFSCFMVCIMIGSSCYQLLLSRGYNSGQTLTLAVWLNLFSMCLCVFSTSVTNPRVFLSLASFFLLELSIGIYFPSISFLRSLIIPESHRANIMNWFRVPMNVITCTGLLWLHHENKQYGNQSIFSICTALMFVALISVRIFHFRVVHLFNQPTPQISPTKSTT